MEADPATRGCPSHVTVRDATRCDTRSQQAKSQAGHVRHVEAICSGCDISLPGTDVEDDKNSLLEARLAPGVKIFTMKLPR
jgi:hypothetical protein